MGKSYIELLKHPSWQRKRLEILNRDGFKCVQCGSGEAEGRTLHVDHQRYEKGKQPWQVEDTFLQTLCEDCHKEITALRAYLREGIDTLPSSALLMLIGVVTATHMMQFRDVEVPVDPEDEHRAQGIGMVFCLTAKAVHEESSKAGGVLTGRRLVEVITARINRRRPTSGEITTP